MTVELLITNRGSAPARDVTVEALVLRAQPCVHDFLYVAPGAVHRESNPSDEECRIVVVRSGSGEPVFNVEESH